MAQETNTQSETKSNLVNDIEYIGTDIRSAYNRMDSKEAEALQEYIYAGERLEELKKKVKKAGYNWKEWGPEYFNKGYTVLNNNVKFSKWCAKQKSATWPHFLQISEKDRIIVIENLKTSEEVNEFFAKSSHKELHGSSLRKAIKIYKGEVSPSEDTTKKVQRHCTFQEPPTEETEEDGTVASKKPSTKEQIKALEEENAKMKARITLLENMVRNHCTQLSRQQVLQRELVFRYAVHETCSDYSNVSAKNKAEVEIISLGNEFWDNALPWERKEINDLCMTNKK